MEVRQKIGMDFVGRENVQKETVTADAKPRYPIRHVVDGVALITLPAAQYDDLVESVTILMMQSNQLIEAFKAYIEEQRAEPDADAVEVSAAETQAEPPAPDASEMRAVTPIDVNALVADHVEIAPRREKRPGKPKHH